MCVCARVCVCACCAYQLETHFPLFFFFGVADGASRFFPVSAFIPVSAFSAFFLEPSTTTAFQLVTLPPFPGHGKFNLQFILDIQIFHPLTLQFYLFSVPTLGVVSDKSNEVSGLQIALQSFGRQDSFCWMTFGVAL